MTDAAQGPTTPAQSAHMALYDVAMEIVKTDEGAFAELMAQGLTPGPETTALTVKLRKACMAYQEASLTAQAAPLDRLLATLVDAIDRSDGVTATILARVLTQALGFHSGAVAADRNARMFMLFSEATIALEADFTGPHTVNRPDEEPVDPDLTTLGGPSQTNFGLIRRMRALVTEMESVV